MKTSIVVTTINKPNKVIKKLSRRTKAKNWNLVIIGDEKTTNKFKLNYGDFYSINDQIKIGLKFAKICPKNNYSRKNIGYLISMKKTKVIIETDDDNFPKDSFFSNRKACHYVNEIENKGWINIYDYFLKKKEFIWPRGLPLDELNNKIQISKKTVKKNFYIQQNVCDNNPDVDSIYRIIHSKINIKFKNKKISLGNSLSTFNSQNTTWFKEVFILMYLPVTCTMRCTDIWRSIIALRIMHIDKKKILFNGPTMSQFRNEHNLIRDFTDEIPMFENNKIIYKLLLQLKLKKGQKYYSENLYKCYKKLVNEGILKKKELIYLKAWISDYKKITKGSC